MRISYVNILCTPIVRVIANGTFSTNTELYHCERCYVYLLCK